MFQSLEFKLIYIVLWIKLCLIVNLYYFPYEIKLYFSLLIYILLSTCNEIINHETRTIFCIVTTMYSKTIVYSDVEV